MNTTMKKNEMRLAENLQRALSSRQLTITALAKRVGMNKSTLHGYSNGVVPRNLLKLRELADFLGLSFAELLFGQEGLEPPAAEELEGRYEITIRRVPKSGKTGKR